LKNENIFFDRVAKNEKCITLTLSCIFNVSFYFVLFKTIGKKARWSSGLSDDFKMALKSYTNIFK